MKALLFTLLFFLLITLSQAQTTFHDPSLDTINGNIGNVDADLNGYLSQQLTLAQLNSNGAAEYGSYSTNSLPYIQTNALGGTNFLNISNSIVSFAGMASNTFSYNGWNSNADGVWVGPTTTNDLIPLGTLAGTTFTMDLSYNFFTAFVPIFTTVGATLRPLILAIFTFMIMREIFEFLEKQFTEVRQKKQISGLKQEFLGTNASGPTGLAYAALITTLMIGLFTFFTAYLLTGPMSGHTTTVSGLGVAVHTFTSGYSIWSLITTFLPISGLVTLLIEYILFRYALAWPLFQFVDVVILFLVS